MRRSFIVAAIAAFGLVAPVVKASNTYTETAAGGFGTATLPAGAQEFFADVFNNTTTYYWDQRGRTVPNADITTNLIDPGNLTSIVPKLWSGSDADLFKIKIVNPATFSASIVSTTNVLTLFAEDGTAITSSRNGGPITGASLPVGFYYIGESQASGAAGSATFGVPRNNANQPLFDFTTDGLKSAIVQADMKLATDPFIAFTTNNGTSLLGPSTFTSGGATITLAGADFAVIPEPSSIGLLGGALLLSLRRRASAGR